jgi:hypothetical protein
MSSLQSELHSLKVSDWLEGISSVSQYKSVSRATIQTHCRECENQRNSKEQVKTLDFSGMKESRRKEQRMFHDICNDCYSALKEQIHAKMK